MPPLLGSRSTRRSLSVRARVVIGVVAMLLPLLVLTVTSILTLRTTLDGFSATTREATQHSLPLARLQSLVLRVERAGIEAVWKGDPSSVRAYRTASARMTATFEALDTAHLAEERRLIAAAHSSATATTWMLDTALSTDRSALSLTPSAENQAVMDWFQRHTDSAVRSLEQAQRVSAAHIRAHERAAYSLQRTTTGLIIVVAGLGLLIAVAGGGHLVRSVVRPLHQLRDAVRRLSEGALSHRVELPRQDEFAEFGEAFNEMAADLERSQADLAHQALHDALTGLPNRVLLADRLQQALVRARRRTAATGSVALLVIDLDGFKQVNDTLGHGAGDDVLRAAAGRLRMCLREGDTAARLGGDEFAVLLDGGPSAHAREVADRLLRAMQPAFRHDERELYLSASVGIAMADAQATAEELLRDADLAMYRAKRGGKDRACVFDPSMLGAADERLQLESDLRGALHRGEISLAYQPVYSLDGSTLVSVEALMRWRHPHRGVVSPGEFIPVAEDSGLIGTLGAWALDEACRQLRHWRDTVRSDAVDDLRLNVNLSARQLADSALPTVVVQALQRHRIEPSRLMLEITETTMVTDLTATVERLRRLKDLGVQIAIDDFGTGYSSLAYLQQLPIDQIKIDKTFVDRIATPEGAALAEGIINMARALTLEPIAEGIEDSEQRDALDRLGCRLGQGFHFARPEPPEDISRRLLLSARTTAA